MAEVRESSGEVPTCQFPTPEEEDAGRKLALRLGIHTVMGKILYRRGNQTTKAVRQFLYPSLDDLTDPFQFPQMEEGVARIGEALRQGEVIWLYGDYDADGITGVAILGKMLRYLGAEVRSYIPHRTHDGYGLQSKWVQQALKEGMRHLICVDNGTQANEAIHTIKEAGGRVWILDHHLPQQEPLPPADVILNPKLESPNSAVSGLASAGIALKFAMALGEAFCNGHQKRSLEFHALLHELMALAAVGTIADLAPLVGDNRILVRFGLLALSQCQSPGLGELLSRVGLLGRSVGVDDVGFRLAPLLNAPGRMGDPHVALELLEASSTQEAACLSRKLAQQNQLRRKMVHHIYSEALAQLQSQLREGGLVTLASKEWHSGVIGIVAARIASEYQVPVILIAQDQHIAKGSARAPLHSPVFPLLEKLKSHFLGFGGHMHAAGFTLPPDRVDSFLEAAQKLWEKEMRFAPPPSLFVDARLRLEEINRTLWRDLELLEPLGMGNPAPLFWTSNVQIAGKPRTSAEGEIQLLLRQNRTTLSALFPKTLRIPQQRQSYQMLFHLSRGRIQVQSLW